MYSRFRDGLLSPKSIVDYIKDKMYRPFIQLLLYALIMLIPVVINNLNYKGLPYNATKQIAELFNGDSIPFKIENGLLETNQSNDYVYTKSINEIVDVRISKTESTSPSTRYIVELSNESIKIKMAYFTMYTIKYSDYEEIKNIDLSKLSNPNAVEWDNVFSLINSFLKDYLKSNILASSIANFIEYYVFLIFITLIISTSYIFRFRNILKYSAMFKMSAYYSAPFVVGMLLTNLFGINIFYIIGLLISLIYAFVGSTTIISRLLNQDRK